MRHKLMTMTAIIAMLGTMSPSALADTHAVGGLYSDVTRTSYGGQQIIALTSDGYLQGFSDGAFRPDAVMTRGEFAADLKREWNPGMHTERVVDAHAPITPSFVATLFVQTLARDRHVTLAHGQTALAYATALGLFRGVHLAGSEASSRASAAILLYNALSYRQGTLLPNGDVPVVTGSASTVSPNSLVSLHVFLRMPNGRMVPVPSSAAVTLSVTESPGALLLSSTRELMISSPGVYQVTAVVDGVSAKPWTVTAGDPPSAVHITASRTVLPANGKATALITATVVDEFGHTETNFSGTAALTPLLHGTDVDPATGAPITSVTFIHGIARFAVQAGTAGGVSDTVTLDDLTSASGQPITTSIDYGWVTMDYAWGSDQPAGVQITAAHGSVLANGQQTDAITATVVNTYGQAIHDFSGSAQLTPLLHGTYRNPTTQTNISSVTFVHGVAHFDIVAGTTGGVNDTVSLFNLTDASGTPLSTAINYGSATISYEWASNQPVAIDLTPATSTLLANGEQTDPITATVVNALGEPVTNFSGVAELTPLQHGTYVNPTTGGLINSVTFSHGIAHFAVQAGTTGGVTDTVSLADLTDSGGQAIASTMNYGTATIDYTWSSAQPVAVTLTPSTSTLVANGTQTATITATVMDAFGQPATGFNGTALLAPLQHGSYVDPVTGGAISSVTFANGVATFGVQAGTIGGVSDTVSLADLTSSNGQAVSAVNNGSATIDYTWPTANSITLAPTATFVSDTSATEDEILANIPQAASGSYAAGSPIEATFSLSGPGSFTQGGTPQTSLTQYIIPGTPTIVPVWSIAGQSGTITVTASSAGISPAQTTLQAGATGQATSLSVDQASETINAVGNAQESTLTEGTPFSLYTVGLMDASGHPVVPQNNDPLTVSDNTNQVGGTLEYFAVANDQPTGPALTAAQLGAAISSSTGQVQFAVVNTEEGTTNPSITITDSLGLSTVVPYTFSAGTPAYAMFPLDTVGNLTDATQDMEDGQTATYAVQLEDVNGNPVSASGQTVDLYFAAKSNTQKVEIDGSSTWSASTPFTTTTNPEGQAIFTVTVPQGVGGAVTLDAAVPGTSGVSTETLAIESPTQYTTTLTLGAGVGAPAISWPTGDMAVGQTLLQYLNESANGLLGALYATPLNASGEYTRTNDALEITSSNPSVLALTPNANWTELNGSTLMLVGNVTSALPTITALSAGTATLTITDIANPSAPRISEVINVQ